MENPICLYMQSSAKLASKNRTSATLQPDSKKVTHFWKLQHKLIYRFGQLHKENNKQNKPKKKKNYIPCQKSVEWALPYSQKAKSNGILETTA